MSYMCYARFLHNATVAAAEIRVNFDTNFVWSLLLMMLRDLRIQRLLCFISCQHFACQQTINPAPRSHPSITDCQQLACF